MKLPDERDQRDREPKTGSNMVKMTITVSLFVLGVLILVLILNRPEKNSGSGTSGQTGVVVSSQQESEETSHTVHTGSPDDFDFWDYGATEEPVSTETETSTEESVAEDDPSTDGKHTLIVHADGEEEWVVISPYLPKNDYDFTQLVSQSDLMKYYENGKQTSFVGIDVSKNQEYVDFGRVKRAGIDYVMIRVGARGYSTGTLLIDEYFEQNIKNATAAGLKVGLYFFSQATTKEEAVEEANLVLECIGEYDVQFPIAFDMEPIANDTSRIDGLSREERTQIAKAFLETIYAAGYQGVVYGNKEWLIKKVDLSKLTAFDVWLSQPGDLPDYPYKFSMWQYSVTGSVDGVTGYVDLNICFIDYTEK